MAATESLKEEDVCDKDSPSYYIITTDNSLRGVQKRTTITAITVATAAAAATRKECGTNRRQQRHVSSFLQPTSVYFLDLKDQGGLKHRVLEWRNCDEECKVNNLQHHQQQQHQPPVVFFHANSVGPGCWAPIVRRLIDNDKKNSSTSSWNYIAVESRGHGDTQVCSSSDSDSDSDSDSNNGDDVNSYRWDLFADDYARIITALTERYSGPPRAVVTHSFSGDCALLSIATGRGSGDVIQQQQQQPPSYPLILLDPVLADTEGATIGAERLAKGTRRLGEREEKVVFATPEATSRAYFSILQKGMVRTDEVDDEVLAAFTAFSVKEVGDHNQDGNVQYRLKCRRKMEAAVYQNRISIGDILDDLTVNNNSIIIDADVQLIFSSKRRGKDMKEQKTNFVRDW
eukprot:CAMPEP_0194358462 /NCGR_PEP_ID=MMETSP0174-20130528/5654_1 /TAXON_ID=216777 /ORGANISM="Proboscia alata, Strain PI-D3" /LENGTH=400 /DNA_ID=CAMNT_0039128773 /DNA_START=38 /DNA_END=1239 /DNA_ORIENTATION=+